jgi:hypothetical protein
MNDPLGILPMIKASIDYIFQKVESIDINPEGFKVNVNFTSTGFELTLNKRTIDGVEVIQK